MKLKEVLNLNLLKTNDDDKKDSIKWLLLSLLNLSYSEYFLNEDLILSKKFIKKYEKLVNKYLNKNIPVQYLAKKSYFYSYEFYIDKNVLIPRSDTEGLVSNLNKLINEKFKNKKTVKVLDLGSGSGIIGITLKLINNKIDVTLSDISNKALKVCRKNIINYNLNIKTIKSNWFNNINEKYDVIVSNPPYIKDSYHLDPHVLKEPHIALFSGKQGLDSYSIILKDIKNYLNDNFIIAFEHGYDQKDKLKELVLNNFNNVNIIQKKDLSEKDRYTFIIK